MKTIMACVVALFYCGLAMAQTPAVEPPPTEEQVKNAYRQVQTARHFSIGGAGFAGALSDAEIGLRVLVRAKDARLLESLTQEKNPVAQLYGLMGMQKTANPEYKRFATRFEQSDSTVLVLRGCLMSLEKISVVTRRLSEPKMVIEFNPSSQDNAVKN